MKEYCSILNFLEQIIIIEENKSFIYKINRKSQTDYLYNLYYLGLKGLEKILDKKE